MERDRISIIVPVYNVEKYLDKCISSILKQTYQELDILLIDDGSTDGSLAILQKYKEADKRIRVITKENEGLGPTRNVGVDAAEGDYIMFVDSDDWITENCVELLYEALSRDHTEIAIGDFAKTAFESEQVERVSKQELEAIVDVGRDKEKLFSILTFSFARLYKKSLFTRHAIRFPAHTFEDASVIPLLYAVAGRISYVKEVVYYYRNRQGSIVNNMGYIYDRMRVLTTLREGLKRLGLYEAYEKEFLEYVGKRSRLNCRKVKKLTERQLLDFEMAQAEYVYKNFGVMYDKQRKVYVHGSYNLMIVSKILLLIKKHDFLPNYYGFENIISAACSRGKKLSKIKLSFENPFRLKMFLQDFGKSFMALSPLRFQDIDYVFIDFLDERYDTGCYQGEYFTLSDGIEAASGMPEGYTVIPSFTEEWRRLWFEQCDRFIQRLRLYMEEENLVLVKLKLAERYGEVDCQSYFPNLEEIRKVNDSLEECYRYFQEKCPKAMVIEAEDLDCYYTDVHFRHGCFPWHLNEKAYKEIARKIISGIEEK